MDATRWQRAQALFHEVLERPVGERDAFLVEAAAGDAELLAEVRGMLRGDESGSVLDGQVAELADRMLGGTEKGIPGGEIGPYRLIELLGEGGMGVVWKARREDTGAVVAIKLLLHAGMSPARRERFGREVRTLAKLRHNYIARLYDAGELGDGTPWFAMECVDGVPLTEFAAAKALTVAARLELFRKVCEAVEYAQGQAVVHRDLKPSNILVEADGTPKLLDFGIARELEGLDEGRTVAGLRFGSERYAAPEWLQNGTVGLFTDVYSLGVILFELLAGRHPDATPSAGSERAAHGGEPEERREKPSAAADGMGLSRAAWSELDLIYRKATRQEVAERYASAEALLRDVNHYLQDEPLEARPDSVRYRLRKFVARNRRAVLATAAVIALVAGLSVAFTVRLAKARDAALAEAARRGRIQDLMLSFFGSTQKTAAPSKDLRAVDLLAEGVKRADTLKGDPETQADLYKTLGRMYNLLGDSATAERLLGLSLERTKAAYGPDNVEVADLLVMRGAVLGDESRFAEGEAEVRAGLAMAERHAAPEDEIFFAKSALGRVKEASGDYKGAVALLQPLAGWRPTTENGAQNLSDALSALAVSEQSLGAYEQAIAMQQELVAMDRRVYGEGHPRLARDIWNIGVNEVFLLRYAEAEEHLRQAAKMMEAWGGAENPEAASAKSALARVLMLEGKDGEAEAMLRQALATQERAYGGKDFTIAATLDTLGRIAIRRGEFPEAETDLKRALEMDRSLFGDKNYQTAVIRGDLGDAYVRGGEAARGEPELRASVAVLKEVFPPGDAHIGRGEVLWGHALVALRRYREAEAPLAAGLEILGRQRSPVAEMAGARADLAVARGAEGGGGTLVAASR